MLYYYMKVNVQEIENKIEEHKSKNLNLIENAPLIEHFKAGVIMLSVWDVFWLRNFD